LLIAPAPGASRVILAINFNHHQTKQKLKKGFQNANAIIIKLPAFPVLNHLAPFVIFEFENDQVDYQMMKLC